ncbi:MAG TPA: response regulator [Chthoniobacterales bacterium]
MKENTVLLVDADGDSERIVSEAATRTGRDVLVAKTSRDAFKILGDQMQRLDLVIVDVDPGAHGLALLEAISGCADRPPIVVITALEETYMKPISMKHGAAACLGKPITIQKLCSSLNDVSQRSLTCDRWGCLIPSTGNKELNLNACFSGIAAKLSPTVSSRGRSPRGRAKKSGKRLPQKIKTAGPKPVCLHRRSASEFTCGIDDQRAFLVEESLDERERRG